jgi:hypothetical protein
MPSWRCLFMKASMISFTMASRGRSMPRGFFVSEQIRNPLSMTFWSGLNCKLRMPLLWYQSQHYSGSPVKLMTGEHPTLSLP